jgi:ADP-ribosylglycohydrolase
LRPPRHTSSERQDTLDESGLELEVKPSRDRYRASVLLAAIGDALGWPTEAAWSTSERKEPVTDFIRWKKLVGGRWWGYHDIIEPGQYSDDTQLSLAVSRCLDDHGVFSPEEFAYLELPLWLQYERGGGRSVKAAARSLINGKRDWTSNFYNGPDVNYFSAGGNGSAMRNLPLALAHVSDERLLVADSFINCIITHGHPRAIVGTILFGLAVRHALSSEAGQSDHMIRYLNHSMQHIPEVVKNDKRIRSWIASYESKNGDFGHNFTSATKEVIAYLNKMPQYYAYPVKDYYREIGALDPATKGSGTASVCAAIFQFLRQNDAPEDVLLSTVNMLGSDTDTISNFAGALVGAQLGQKAVPSYLADRLQDKEYLDAVADNLVAIATRRDERRIEESSFVDRKDAYLRIMAWEIGLHEMFWDAIGVDGTIVHPTLGRGKIVDKRVESLIKEGFKAKLLSVRFDSGQSCVFHSRVRSSDGELSESFAKEISKSLHGLS